MRHFILFSVIVFTSVRLNAQCDSIEALNMQIYELAKAKLGKKVDRGECWDLAKYVLDKTECEWDGMYKFGRELSSDECVMPGDIIQFKNVKIKYKKGNTTYTEAMTHHTALVHEVKSENEYVLIHQNTGYTGRKVGISGLRLETIIKGSIKIYRPIKKS